MDVHLNHVSECIQDFIYKLIEVNDWVFHTSHILQDAAEDELEPPVITMGHVLHCFGNDEHADVELAATPAKGPHSCGTLRTTLDDVVQFYLGGSSLQLYFTPSVEIWYWVNRGDNHNAVKLVTFDRIGLVFADGRHRGIRNIIMSDSSIDLRLSDETNDVVSLCVVN